MGFSFLTSKGGAARRGSLMLAPLVALLSGIAQADGGYQRIDPATAQAMMAKDDGHVVVDVRRPDEYRSGHIPGAILIPNESIGQDRPAALPDLKQVILVYCRSGNRSRQASRKLVAMGYERVFDFGGLNTWPGDLTGGDDAVGH